MITILNVMGTRPEANVRYYKDRTDGLRIGTTRMYLVKARV
jgi:hypothetical protein